MRNPVTTGVQLLSRLWSNRVMVTLNSLRSNLSSTTSVTLLKPCNICMLQFYVLQIYMPLSHKTEYLLFPP